MPTVLTSSQQTFVDITDQRKLSAYITSNLPKTQSEDPNVLPRTPMRRAGQPQTLC